VIFADKRNYNILRGSFIGDYMMFYAFLDSIKRDNMATPSDATSIDKSKRMLVVKTFNEHSERALMGLRKKEECDVINFIDKTVCKLNKIDFTYGFNSQFGHSDTTGTASGHRSHAVIKKAVLELLEKNELLGLWYGKKGSVLELSKYSDLVNNFKFISPNVDIFLCNELSNYYTIIVVLSSDDKITSSGIAIDSCFDDALSLALQEAKLLEWCNYDSSASTFAKWPAEVHMEAKRHLDNLSARLIKKSADRHQYKAKSELEINKFIRSIYIRMLNASFGKRELTIKCISMELFNCLPRSEWLKSSIDKDIIKYFNIDETVIDSTPECILL